MPANPDISATIKHDGTTIETLTDPTVTDLGSGIYRLDWTDVISSDTTVVGRRAGRAGDHHCRGRRRLRDPLRQQHLLLQNSAAHHHCDPDPRGYPGSLR